MSSNLCASATDCDGSAIFTMYQPTQALSVGAVFVEVVVAEEEIRLIRAGVAS